MKSYQNFSLPGFYLIFNAHINAQKLIAAYEFDRTMTYRLGNSSIIEFGINDDRNNIQSGFLDDNKGICCYWFSNLANGGRQLISPHLQHFIGLELVKTLKLISVGCYVFIAFKLWKG